VILLRQVVLSSADVADLPKAVADLLAWWQAACGAQPVPPKAAVTPESLRRWLGDLSLVERVGSDFRYRVYGSNLAQAAGFDLTGRMMSAAFTPEVARFYTDQYELASRERRPVFSINTRPLHMGVTARRWQRLVMPLSDVDGAIGFFLVHVQVEDPS
jgi:hypothetical protein